MIVAVENGLNDISSYLTDAGYDVVNANNHRGAVDAYVYQREGLTSSAALGGVLSNSTQEGGILMINASNKTPAEILNILVSRIYGDIINFF